MKHHKKSRTLRRPTKQRTALLRSMARSLILHGRIETTEAKAKELRPFVEKLVTAAKAGDREARRLVAARLGGEQPAARVLTKLFSDVATAHKERAGGYTRITKLPRRATDAARMAVIEFV